MATPTASQNTKSKALASQLASVAKVAKSLGINTAKSDSMVAQTNAQGARAYKGSSYDKGQKDVSPVINSKTISPAPDLASTIPPAPILPGLATQTNATNSALAYSGGGTYDVKTNQMVSAPPVQDSARSLLDQQLAQMQKDKADMPSNVDALKESRKMYRPQEQLVNSLQGQLNTITSSRDSEMLKLEGQGRGQTEGFVGGEQARISREAAIMAMPVQAQLAAAQDDLESARTYAGQYFQAKMQDAQAQYQYQKDVHATIFKFLDNEQQRALAVKDKEDDRAFQTTRDHTSMLQNLADKAMEYGYGSKLGGILALDVNSPTFMEDYARVASGIQKPLSTTTTKRDTQIVDGKLIDMQTGEVISTIGVTSGEKPRNATQILAQGFADRTSQANEIINALGSQFTGVASYLGAALPNFMKTSDRQNYEQAQRNFVNSVLRRESGAVISDQEFENARQQYFPQPGDGESVLIQKAQNRDTVVSNLFDASNSQQPVSPGTIIESEGVKYKVGSDGVTLEPV